MEREFKGHAIQKHVEDYCVIDLETTNACVSDAEILELSAIKVRDNQVVDEFSTLINPECHIPPEATAVNDITDDMVKDAPLIDDVIDSFIDFVGDDVIVGYNNAGFDMNIIYDLLLEIRGKTFSNNYIDTLHSARRCLSKLNDHRLETVSKYYSIDTSGEHRALKDCYITKSVYDNLFNEYGDEPFRRKTSSEPHIVRYSSETLALQELQSLLEDTIKDGEITHTEFYELQAWMETHRNLQGNYPFDRVFNAIDNVIEDGRIEPEELYELQILFSGFVDPVKSHSFHTEINNIDGKHVVVTGDFDYGSRSEVCDIIASAGGINDKAVSKTTDYVVVGAKGSAAWKTGNYGGKIQKAMELKDKGFDIAIVEEGDFIPAINRICGKGVNDKQEEISIVVEDLWKQKVQEMLDTLIKEYDLPAGSLYLNLNENKTRQSYSVCIWEPNYPQMPNDKQEQNGLVLTIIPSKATSRPEDLDITIKEAQELELHMFLPADAQILTQTQSDKNSGAVRIRINRASPFLIEYIRQNTIYCIKRYISKNERFGCCSLFEKCSEAKRCIHKNKLYSKACIYRDNLEKGNIFYGKNRNID